MIEAMKQWREAFKDFKGYRPDCDEAIKSMDKAIAEADRQDKFCDNNCVWTDHHKDCVRASVSWKDMAFARLGVVRDKMHPDDVATVQRFLDGDYTHPQPKREWVGLTVMEAVELDIATNHPREFAAAIEAKLKEKNT